MDAPIHARMNKEKQRYEVSCSGFFRDYFFDHAELTERQEMIFDLYKKTFHPDRKKELQDLYLVTEYMRVKLLTYIK